MVTAGTPPVSTHAAPLRAAGGGDETVVRTARPPRSAVATITSPQFTRVADDGQPVQVGRYEVLEPLGRGGMASVVRARDPALHREVAIKFLHADLCVEGECRTRFLREAKAAGRLSHPNIVVVHDVGEIDGRPYMAMELLDGGSLADDLDRRRRLPVAEVVAIGIQLARALDYAHRRGVVHRDIKPGNVLRDATSGVVKLTDFGIAHLDEPAAMAEHRTRIGDVIGTPQYMSPEQARGEPLDGRSDLFSLGIVLYQMLCGAAPFRGDTLVAVATRIVNQPTPPIGAEHAVPGAVRRVIERCLDKLADRRFQTGAELAEALSRVYAFPSAPPAAPTLDGWGQALRQAVIVGSMTALVAAGAAWGCLQAAKEALLQQGVEQGRAFGRLLAEQHAAQVLDDDWGGLDVAVERLLASGQVEQVAFLDRAGAVRATGQRGGGWPPPAVASSGALPADAEAHHRRLLGRTLLEVRAPIRFQGKPVGALWLVWNERPQRGLVDRLAIGLAALGAASAVAAALTAGVSARGARAKVTFGH